LAVYYKGNKLTHFTVSKIDNKISVWGDLGTSPPQLFGRITPIKSATMVWCTVRPLVSERLVSKTKTMPDSTQ